MHIKTVIKLVGGIMMLGLGILGIFFIWKSITGEGGISGQAGYGILAFVLLGPWLIWDALRQLYRNKRGTTKNRELVNREEPRQIPKAGHEGNWVDYLRGKGVEAEVVELHAPFWKYQSTKRAVRLSGKNVDEIWILPRTGPGANYNTWDTHFRVLLDRPLLAATKKTLAAKSKLIRQNKRLGIFGGEITDVKWVGGGIAHALNQDTDLRMMILDVAQFISEIRIKPAGESAVTIRKREPEGRLSLIDDEFEIYDRIAKHVREVVNAY